jgi:hypothetical protein
LDKTYYFLDETLRQFTLRAAASPADHQRQKGALPVGADRRLLNASVHRSIDLARKAPRLGLG